MLTELRSRLRVLLRSPGFTTVAVLSLALSIGANTALFSILDQMVLRSMDVADPQRLVVLHHDDGYVGLVSSDNFETVFSRPMFLKLRERNQVFEELFGRAGFQTNLSYAGTAERATVEAVTGNYFDGLGLRPVVGRLLNASDDRTAGAHPVAVLSYSFWRDRLGGNPLAVGQKMNVNGFPMTIVGVAPRGFHGLVTGQTAQAFVPIAMKRVLTPTWDGTDDARAAWLNLFGRLRPGVSAQQAQAGLLPLYRALLSDELHTFPPEAPQDFRQRFVRGAVQLMPAGQGVNELKRSWSTALIALMCMVAMVLLLACANVANLLIARAAARRREIAVRLSLGAGRWVIVRSMLVESALLAFAGGAGGLLASVWIFEALRGLLPAEGGAQWLAASLDWRVFAFNFGVAALAALLAGLAPAFKASRGEILPGLGGARSAGGGDHTRLRRVIVAGQFALALLLLAAAGLFSTSLARLLGRDAGFRSDGVVTFGVSPADNGYDLQRTVALIRDIRERLTRVPGVTSVSASEDALLTGDSRARTVRVEGYRSPEGSRNPTNASINAAAPGFFRTLGIPVRNGREFEDRDAGASPKPVVVNAAFARRFYNGENPVGRRVGFGGTRAPLDMEIVGVVGDSTMVNLRDGEQAYLYTPLLGSEAISSVNFFVRTARPAESAFEDIRKAVHQADASLPVFRMQTMRERLADSIHRDRIVAFISVAFGVAATLLAAIGLYGVVSFSVVRRTAEIGIRMALGAAGRDVVRLVLRDVAVLSVAGAAVGLPLALLLGRYVESQLFGMKAANPLVLAAATAVLLGVAALAGLLPARRAVRIHPLTALRHE